MGSFLATQERLWSGFYVFRNSTNVYGSSLRKKEEMRQMATKSLMRFIMDVVEKANLYDTTWGRVQSAKSRRKPGGEITAVKEENAKNHRKPGGIITGVKRKSAESRRKVGGKITGAKRKSAKSRRKVGGKITGVKRKSAKSHRKMGGIITRVKRKSAKSRRNLPVCVHKEPTCGRRF